MGVAGAFVEHQHLFNNVAIAARQYRRLFNKRVVIFDWVSNNLKNEILLQYLQDIHHGNGTQQEFYSDPEVNHLLNTRCGVITLQTNVR